MTILDDPTPGPGTHVLIIGVGQYPHLIGGDGPLLLANDGLRQLSSPPLSARRLAAFFLEQFRNPARPLRSLSLLTSEAPDPATNAPRPFDVARLGDHVRVLPQGMVPEVDEVLTSHAIPAATMANVKAAVADWFKRGDQCADNLLLCFFSGHGLGMGADVSLLLSDYGEDPLDPLSRAIDLRKFHLGMDRCKARHQCWFVDACRTASNAAPADMSYLGVPMVQPQPSFHPTPRLAPVYHSTLAGYAAYGRPNDVSLYTEMLLQSFEGAGSDQIDGQTWTVNTGQLARALGQTLKRAAADHDVLQIASCDGVADEFDIHQLPGDPLVPVYVTCTPTDAQPSAAFSCVGTDTALQRPPAAEEWKLRLEPGTYVFRVEFAPGLPWLGAEAPPLSPHPPLRTVTVAVEATP